MGIWDGLQSAAETLRKADKIPEYKEILEAMDRIMELQVANFEATQRISQLERELEAIRCDQLNSVGIERDGNVFRLKGVPYCVHCFIVDKRLGPIVSVTKGSATRTYTAWQCTRCKQEVRPQSVTLIAQEDDSRSL